jgi:hypothetical protein
MARRVCGSAMLYDSTTGIIQIQTQDLSQYPALKLSAVLDSSLRVVDDFAVCECKGENGRDDVLDIVFVPRLADGTNVNGPGCYESV